MNTQIIGDYSAYLQYKEQLTQIFEQSIKDTLTNMGEDIKGIAWFSVAADEYTASTFDKAI